MSVRGSACNLPRVNSTVGVAMFTAIGVVGAAGIEPATSAMSTPRSPAELRALRLVAKIAETHNSIALR